MNKEEAIAKISAGENADFEVFTTDEHKTYLENFAKQELEKKLPEEIGKLHKQYDDDLFDLFGERKPGAEKTYNFLKRKFTDLKSEAETSKTYQKKISELEEAIKNNAGDEQLKRDLENVKKEYSHSKKEWETKELTLSQQMDSYKLLTELDKAMVGLEFKKDIPQEVKDTYIDRVKNDLLKSAKIVDGKMIFIKEDGSTDVNKDNALNPFTPQEKLKIALASILTTTKEFPGPPKPEKKIVDGKEVVTLPNPGAKTRMEVTKYLKDNGIAQGSKDYNRMYKEFTEDLPSI